MLGPIAPANPPAAAPRERDGDEAGPGRDAALAEDPGRARVVQRLERFESLDGVDAANANLVGIDLSGKSLVGARTSLVRSSTARGSPGRC